MIGTVGADHVYRLLDALMAQDGTGLLQQVEEMSQLATDFTSATRELLAMLHQIALLQAVPEIAADEAFDASRLKGFAGGINPEDVQLFYQIGLTGQRELHLAPDPRSGFEMLLLRMLAFRPVDAAGSVSGSGAESQQPTIERGRVTQQTSSARQSTGRKSSPRQTVKAEMPDNPEVREPAPQAADPAQWDSFVAALKLGGIASQLAHHSVFESWDGETLCLKLDTTHRHLRVGQAEARLQDGISNQLGRTVKLKISEAIPEAETPAMRQEREQRDRQREAEASMSQDPLVKEMEEHFSAKLVSDSIRPVD